MRDARGSQYHLQLSGARSLTKLTGIAARHVPPVWRLLHGQLGENARARDTADASSEQQAHRSLKQGQ